MQTQGMDSLEKLVLKMASFSKQECLNVTAVEKALQPWGAAPEKQHLQRWQFLSRCGDTGT